jgi:hypothetical protein
VPANLSSLRLRIINNGTGSNGNDFALDDIEIRLCAPEVRIPLPHGNDTVFCEGATFSLTGNYTDDGTFGNALRFYWEHSATGNINETADWTVIAGYTNVAGSEITDDLTGISVSENGYYRLAVQSQSTQDDAYNCRALSRVIHLEKISSGLKVPDIRIDVCPQPDRQIHLTAFLDSVNHFDVSWQKLYPSSPALIDPRTGEISSSDMRPNAVYTYRYSFTSQCGLSSAIAYVHAIGSRKLRNTDTLTLTVCRSHGHSVAMYLNAILGLDLGGEWFYDSTVNPDNTVSDNVTVFPVPSMFHGALAFNARKAWETAGTAYDIAYGSYTAAKKFLFRYVPDPSGNCISQPRILKVIVTE